MNSRQKGEQILTSATSVFQGKLLQKISKSSSSDEEWFVWSTLGKDLNKIYKNGPSQVFMHEALRKVCEGDYNYFLRLANRIKIQKTEGNVFERAEKESKCDENLVVRTLKMIRGYLDINDKLPTVREVKEELSLTEEQWKAVLKLTGLSGQLPRTVRSKNLL
jgi:hypothetical protein